jgi:hypothetical protein
MFVRQSKSSGHGDADLHLPRMSVIKSGHIRYRPSVAARDLINDWDYGAIVELDADDASGKPTAMHLTPASSTDLTGRVTRYGRSPGLPTSTCAP